MAGSGKTTLMQRLQLHLAKAHQAPFIINLDPAVAHVPYFPNIDIRDTVKYKQVMEQYGLGPNGGILTSCNLFATKFDKVMELLERPRDPPLQHILLDTPGQIEMFTWSASGNIISQLVAGSFRTCVLFVVDTPACRRPHTFMSNMLQACSILYKTRLPLVLVLNKSDIVDPSFAREWMTDLDTFQDAIASDTSYASSLSRSLALVLDAFYKHLRTVDVSALAGLQMDELVQAMQDAGKEWEEVYWPDLQARKEELK